MDSQRHRHKRRKAVRDDVSGSEDSSSSSSEAWEPPARRRPDQRDPDPAADNQLGPEANPRRSSRLREQRARVDEIGIIPQKCQAPQNLQDIPPRIASLRAAILRHFQITRSLYGTRDFRYPVNEVFMEWGRKWVIKESTIKHAGLGLFAGEDIMLNRNGSTDFVVKYVPLFPYVGAIYTLGQFDQIAPWFPNMRRYALQMVKGSYRDQTQLLIVGDAREDHNLGAFINSNLNIEHETGPPNCEWQYMDNTFSECHFTDRKCQRNLDIIQTQRQIRYYVMTVARRNIAMGDELFVRYDFRNT